MKRRAVLSLAARWAAVVGAAPLVDACAAPTAVPATHSAPRPPLLFSTGEPLPWDALEQTYFAAKGVHLAPARLDGSDWPQMPGAPMVTVEDFHEVDVTTLTGIPWTGSFGYNAPLESRLRDRNFDASGIDADVMAAFSADGHVWGVPFSAVPLVIYYHPSAFGYTQVPLPQPGWTLTDMLSTCARLAETLPRNVVIFDGESARQTRAWATFVAARAGRAITDGTGAVIPWSAAVRQGLADYAALRTFSGPGQVAQGIARAADIRGAMWLAAFHPGDWTAVRSGDIGIAPFPTVTDRRLLPLFPMGHGVGAKGADPKRALDFIQWSVSAEGQRFSTNEGWPPVRRALLTATQWMPVQPSQTCDPLAFTAPSAQRWWPPAQLWSQIAGSKADALGDITTLPSDPTLQGLWNGLRAAMTAWRTATAMMQGVPDFYLDFRPLPALAANPSN